MFNLLSRSKELLEPLKAERVSIYTCGPHTQRRLQLGEARRFVLADLLRRYLRWRGYAVTQVVDISDIEEDAGAASERAATAGGPPSHTHLEQFMHDLDWLRIQPAEHYPRARDHADAMVSLARKLAAKGFAYEKLRSLYFDLSRLPGYGRLSGIDIAKVKARATVDGEAFEKQNPRDFALFKRCRLSELKRGAFMKTEWGNVRPSWHLQTTAMAMHYLGERFDVHTSSRELLFPHHENENAIAAALEGKPLANYWIHADRVLANGLGLAELQAMGFSGRETRFWLMSTHYRRPAAGSVERLEDARRSVQRLDRCVQALMRVGPGRPCPELDQLIYDIRQGVRRGMDDDLDLPSVIAAVFHAVKRINAFVAQGLMDARGAGRLVAALKDIDAVLGIFDFSGTPVLEAEIQELLEAREKARAERQWELADRIRDELRARRITVQDQKAPRS